MYVHSFWQRAESARVNRDPRIDMGRVQRWGASCLLLLLSCALSGRHVLGQDGQQVRANKIKILFVATVVCS